MSPQASSAERGSADSGEVGVPLWRGGVSAWECDEMGHMNVRFYVTRAVEGLVGLAHALGLAQAFRPAAQATMLVREQHIRFLREARPGAALHMTGGVIDIGESEARLLLVLVHSRTGEIAASFQTVVDHVTAHEARAFPWSAETRRAAETLRVDVPARCAPRSIGLDPVESGASLAEANRLGLRELSAGAIGPHDCDAFGRMRPEVFIGRVSDGIPGFLREEGQGAPVDAGNPPPNIGGAVLEYRLLHLAWPRAGDRFEIRSGVTEVTERFQRVVHWMIDPVTGRPWGSAEAVAISLDLDARRMIALGPEAQARARERLVPGLAL